MYATNRMNPDRRDPADQAGWNPPHPHPVKQPQARCRQTRVIGHCNTVPIGTCTPIEPPQFRGKASNHKFRLRR